MVDISIHLITIYFEITGEYLSKYFMDEHIEADHPLKIGRQRGKLFNEMEWTVSEDADIFIRFKFYA